jgi:hypothetical protein
MSTGQQGPRRSTGVLFRLYLPLWKAAGPVVTLLLAGQITGCSDDPTGVRGDNPAAATRGKRTQQTRDEFVSIRRLEPQLVVEGSLRPGQPLTIRSVTKANRSASKATYELWSLDDEESGAQGVPRLLGRWSGSLAKGTKKSLDINTLFPNPGYYRILVRAVGRETVAQAEVDTTILDENYELAWVLVDDRGGRATRGFDSTAVVNRMPQFGSYGRFMPSADAKVGTASEIRVSLASATLSGAAAFSYTGRLRYYNYDVKNLVVIPKASIQGRCQGTLNQAIDDPLVNAATDAAGNFAFSCPSNKPYLVGNAYLYNNYVSACGKGCVAAGASFITQNGGFLDLRVANDYAARAFVVLTDRIPEAFARFNRSRSRITAMVADADTGYRTKYTTDDDRIRFNQSTVFGEPGMFAINHEYGHAFHWKAIDPPSSYDCKADEHSVALPYTLSCAFVEGFADFFSVWVAGGYLNAGRNISDNYFENNPYRDNGDGSLIEGAVGAFLYDLVDGASEPDGLVNDAPGEEAWDNAHWPGSYVASLMSSCNMTIGSTTYGRIDGIDEFIYCAERSLAAQALSQYFVDRSSTFTAVAEGATEPATWSSAEVRKHWLYNLYNVGP